MKTALWVSFIFVVSLLVAACAKNEYGIPLKKKPDLSAVQPGTPISKVRGLKKPIKKEALTQGELNGAEAWLFEWNLPNDEVNNRMFTSVVVKDGVVLGWHEETPDKWTKSPELYKAARLDTALENLAAAQARAAYTRMALGALASQNASRAAYDPMQYVNTSTFLYKPEPYTPIPFGGLAGGQTGAQFTAPSLATARPLPASVGSPMGRFNPANPMSEYAKPAGRFNPNNPMSAYSSPTGALNPNNPNSEITKPTGRYNPNNPMGQGVHPVHYQNR